MHTYGRCRKHNYRSRKCTNYGSLTRTPRSTRMVVWLTKVVVISLTTVLFIIRFIYDSIIYYTIALQINISLRDPD